MDSNTIRNRVMDIESSPICETETAEQIWTGTESDGTRFTVSRHVVRSPTRWMQIISLSLEGSAEGISLLVNDFCETYGTPYQDDDEKTTRCLEWCIEDPVFVSKLESPTLARRFRILRILHR